MLNRQKAYTPQQELRTTQHKILADRSFFFLPDVKWRNLLKHCANVGITFLLKWKLSVLSEVLFSLAVIATVASP